MRELAGWNALVTGAAGGLGGHIARALAEQDVNLALSDLPSAPMDGLVEELRKREVRVEAVPADLAGREQAEGLIGRAEDALGSVDILVNNAGVEFLGTYTRTTPDEVDATLAINLRAPMLLTLVALPRMLERGRGHVVNVASLAGKTPQAYEVTYATSKHGLVGFTHSLRAEYGATPVGFSAICPGWVGGVGMFAKVESKVRVPRRLGRLIPAERVGEAVVTAIRENRAEVLVSPIPIRPILALTWMFPRAGVRVIERLGVYEVWRQGAASRDRL
jgi:short-subunit dehydrogenase